MVVVSGHTQHPRIRRSRNNMVIRRVCIECIGLRASFPKKVWRRFFETPRHLTSVRLQATVVQVRIRNFIHKGLKKLYTDDATRGLPPHTLDKLRKMLAFLDDMEDPEELWMLPSWKAHTLMGDRKGAWSLSVTANRRLTFRIDTTEREIYDVNLEDYH